MKTLYINKKFSTQHFYYENFFELKNVLYNFEGLKLLQLKLKIVNIVLFYLLVKNVHYMHKPDAVDSQLIAIVLTILNYSKKVRSLKLNYIFPLICHYHTNFIKVQFFSNGKHAKISCLSNLASQNFKSKG